MNLAKCAWVVAVSAAMLQGQEPGPTTPGEAPEKPEQPAGRQTEKLWDDLRISRPSTPPAVDPDKGGDKFFVPRIGIRPQAPIVQAPFNRGEAKQFNDQMAVGNLHLSSNLYYKASHYFWEAARLQPENEDAASSLAVCFLMAGDSERAIVFYRELVKRSPLVDDYPFNLASALYKAGAYPEAIQELETLIEDHPKEAKLLYNLGINHLAMENREAAIIYLRKSYENLPQNPFPLLAIARLHSQQGQKLEMLAELEKAALLLSAAELRFYLDHPAFKAWDEPGLYDRVISKSL
ncbi:MAG: tetratricopeptide repeat protein [Verrucomicrobiota bacterium]